MVALQAWLSLKVTSCVLSKERTNYRLFCVLRNSWTGLKKISQTFVNIPVWTLEIVYWVLLLHCLVNLACSILHFVCFFLQCFFVCARQANVMWFYYTHEDEDVSPVNLSKTQTNYIWMDMKYYEPERRNMGGNCLVHSSLLSLIISALY